ncbi:hypothetical protein NKDENANG_00620 [Candidatus Entotheonellaceae bacterium PAL068K]
MSPPLEAGLQERIDIIEQTYEFMLAYAAQGLAGDEAGGPGAQIRDFLQRCNDALEGLPDVLKRLVETKQLEPIEPYGSFIDIVEQDTHKTQTAIRLMLAQQSMSSQLIDNLNAWIHLRALLTDLFVIDEILKNA